MRFIPSRRARILYWAVRLGSTRGPLTDLLRNTLTPTCRVLAWRVMQRIEVTDDDTARVWLRGYDQPLFFPRDVPRHALYQTLAEQFYTWQWHYYEVPETTVSNDVVLDCGAAEGLFAFLTRVRAQHIYCFEPLPEFNRCLENTFSSAGNVTVVPVALGSKVGTAYLARNGIASSITAHNTGVPVQVHTVDAFCADHDVRPTYIKADLEGFESQLLLGAREVLRELKPKLALTTYHNAGDAARLTELVLDINPHYRVRHKGIEGTWGAPVMLHAW